jgi:hypothetical protein
MGGFDRFGLPYGCSAEVGEDVLDHGLVVASSAAVQQCHDPTCGQALPSGRNRGRAEGGRRRLVLQVRESGTASVGITLSLRSARVRKLWGAPTPGGPKPARR